MPGGRFLRIPISAKGGPGEPRKDGGQHTHTHTHTHSYDTNPRTSQTWNFHWRIVVKDKNVYLRNMLRYVVSISIKSQRLSFNCHAHFNLSIYNYSVSSVVTKRKWKEAVVFQEKEKKKHALSFCFLPISFFPISNKHFLPSPSSGRVRK